MNTYDGMAVFDHDLRLLYVTGDKTGGRSGPIAAPDGTVYVAGQGVLIAYGPTALSTSLTLSADNVSVPARSAISFMGYLREYYQESGWPEHLVQLSAPIPHIPVAIYETRNDPLEGTIFTTTVATCITDANGAYSIQYHPAATAQYVAVAAKADGTVISQSELLTISVT